MEEGGFGINSGALGIRYLQEVGLSIYWLCPWGRDYTSVPDWG